MNGQKFMSRITKKLFSIFIVIISVFFCLSGCKDETKKESQTVNPNTVSKESSQHKTPPKSQEVNVYSSRLPDLVKPIFDIFTQDTGIKVNFIFLKQGALERLKSEGEFTPADLILVSDIGSIQDIVDADLVSPITSTVVKNNIPTQYRSKDDLWVGLTGRMRMIARTTKDLTIDIHGYNALSNQKLKGRVCSRSLTHPYNVSMVASYLADNGTQATQKWLQNFRKNIFDKPSGDDTSQIDLIASGLCDIAPVNHYYYERMVALDKNLAKKVMLVPLSEMTDGVYANVSGVLVSKYATNYNNAIKLIEFMTQPKSQKVFADHDYEFPLNSKVAHKSNLFKKGTENIKSLSLDLIADNREKALEMIYKLQ